MLISLKFIRSIGCLLVAASWLAGCYVPDRFEASIQINRAGDYVLSYRGDLIWPSLLEAHQGQTDPATIRERRDAVLRDLKRDSHFRSVRAVGGGRFAVDYVRVGRLAASEQVTFVRRNAEIMALLGFDDGRVEIRGAAVTDQNAARLAEAGVVPIGRLRLITDLPVRGTNGRLIRAAGAGTPAVYEWSIRGLAGPAPRADLFRPDIARN